MLFQEPDIADEGTEKEPPRPSFFKRRNIQIPIMAKMLLAFLALTLSSLAIIGYITLNDIRDIGQHAFSNSVSLGEKAITDSTNALELLGMKIIEQRARDVAAQCEIYLQSHPSLTMAELMNDDRFQEIAVQPVGTRGYTLLFEKKTGIILFHLNPLFVRFDTHRLMDQLPTAWELFQATLEGFSKGGYYDWRDPDGVVREKYMYIVPVSGTPYMMAATTYIEEFLNPIEETKKKISETAENISNHIATRMQNTRNTFLDIIILLILFVSGVSFILSRMITLPILSLTEGVQALGRGDLDHKVHVGTSDELGELAASFNQMTRDLKSYMERLHCTTAEQERLLNELEIARRIQQNILPRKTPAIEGMDIWGTNIPAREVGGDFFDYIPIDRTHWGLTIADVSGKGMPAAIFMGLSRTILRASVSSSLNVTAAIRHANELICRDSTSGMFVTLFYGVLDTVEKKLTYINAGHYPAIHLRVETPEVQHLEARGIPLGINEDMELEAQTVTLETGDVLVLYTDGVTEAMNDREEAFGEERLRSLISECRTLSAREMVRKVEDEILLFSGEQPRFDDMTLVILKVL